MLGDRNIFALALAFRGEARGAFAWLQCFIAEEEDWCLTRGCPACIVSKVLEAEPTIRIVLVACRLSQSLALSRSENTTATPSQLPVFDFWLSSLRNALNEDPFWGPEFNDHLERRATTLEVGLSELVSQCFELEALAKGNISQSMVEKPANAQAYTAFNPTRLRTSRVAEKQMPSVREDSTWMQQIVIGCWTTLLADAAKVRRKASVSVSKAHVAHSRTRCLTS